MSARRIASPARMMCRIATAALEDVVAAFDHAGFTGGINGYRNLNRAILAWLLAQG
jgi:hypothetical protein